ncbi:hypothetical protein STCU_09849 [Strigomonas culicis]|uniref:Uncharacterized protein n=1 Tax=Strigomonas culicis TaxID=28005 RepID=S9UVV0_9TRYP|nr:hypothetical protein STCU_09849 [Strigomonas culicis]|eukprot:EPY18626.1 hypothetical protein STCU_09849 [Strigomonas culicis]
MRPVPAKVGFSSISGRPKGRRGTAGTSGSGTGCGRKRRRKHGRDSSVRLRQARRRRCPRGCRPQHYTRGHTPAVRAAQELASTADATATRDEVISSTFASQPEWVRRWAMYEASMGNLDLSDRGQTNTSPETADTAAATTASASLAVVDSGKKSNQPFREVITEWDAHDKEISNTSEATISLMELEAVVEHLYVMQRYSTGAALKNVLAASPSQLREKRDKKRTLVARRPSISPSAMNGTNYAREALRIVRRFVDNERDKGSASGAELSATLIDKLRCLIRVSGSFKLTAEYATFLTRDAPFLATESDALLYLLRLSERRRLALKPHEERFISETLLPLFTVGSAAACVARAWWSSYLCHIKSSRPDDFMELLVSARELFASSTADSAPARDAPPTDDHMQLLQVLHESIENLEEAAPRLSREIQSVLDAKKLRRALMATEGSTGTTVTHSGADEHRLPEVLLDTFSYLCTTVVQVCSLASTAIVRTDPQSLLTLYTFIERVVYGPQGVWAIFQSTYTLGSNDKGNDASSPKAPDRTATCCTTARCALLVAQELCLNGSIHHASNTTNPIKLLLEVSLAALEEVPSQGSQLNSLTVKALVEIRCALLVLIKRLYTFLDLTPENQRVLFGAIRSESVDCLVLYAKLLHRVEVTLHSEVVDRLLTHTKPGLRPQTVLQSATPKTKEVLRLCFVPGNALSSQVATQLSKREREWLLTYMSRRTRVRTRRSRETGTSPLRRFDTIALERRVYIHDRVYRIALGDLSKAEQSLLTLSTSLNGEECLFLLHLLTKNVCVADGLLSMSFFVSVLQQVSAGRLLQPALAPRSETAVASSGAKGVTWMDAIGVFWSAVDHTQSRMKLTDPRRHERDVLDRLLCPLLQVANLIHQRDVGRQWRKVWTRKFSSAERRKSHFLTINAQALALLSDDTALDHSLQLVQSHGRGPAAVGPTTTTETPVGSHLDDATTMPEDLLLRVARQHRSWQSALEALFKVYGEFAEHEASVNPYQPSVAHALLVILGRSRTNLSNTGLRLKTIQHDLWDTQSAVLLMGMLLRARRWKKALLVFEDAKQSHDFRRMDHQLSSGATAAQSPLGEQNVLVYGELHLLALQACAVGGEAEEAARLFTRLKRILSVFDPTFVDPIASGPPTTASEAADPLAFGGEDELELLLDSARMESDMEDGPAAPPHRGPQREDGSGDAAAPYVQQLRDIVMRGRRLFLRATTKKMMKAPFSRIGKD